MAASSGYTASSSVLRRKIALALPPLVAAQRRLDQHPEPAAAWLAFLGVGYGSIRASVPLLETARDRARDLLPQTRSRPDWSTTCASMPKRSAATTSGCCRTFRALAWPQRNCSADHRRTPSRRWSAPSTTGFCIITQYVFSVT